MADITYSSNPDTGETTFSADTPEGEEFLGGKEVTVSNSEAAQLKAQAEEEGLAVLPFP